MTPALRGHPVQLVRNYRWREGISTSINLGISVLPQETDSAIFLQVDQPLLTRRLLQALATRRAETGAEVVVPTWQEQRGSPVLFGRALFPELARLTGDTGGRALFETYRDRLVTLPVDDPLQLADVDTPDRYETLRASATASPETILGPVRAVICDMDGVLWRGETPLPGLHDFFALLTQHHIRYMLVTNNASRTPSQYVEKLARFGIDVTLDHVLNAALAAADYLKAHADPGAWVYPVGEIGVREALLNRGFRLSAGESAEHVVVGWAPSLTWQTLAAAARLIQRGAQFIVTNPDRSFPAEDGLVPGAGAQLAFLQAATGVPPIVAGKPEPILYEQAIARMEAAPHETLVIGDRLDTDILGGLRMGLSTVMLFSGIQGPEDLPKSPIHPDLVFDDLATLVTAWRSVKGD